MPDGTVTNLKAVNGKWLVDSGSTNTAVSENQELGTVDSIPSLIFQSRQKQLQKLVLIISK